MQRTNTSAWHLSGESLPDPSTITSEGTVFYVASINQMYWLSIDQTTGTKTWRAVADATPLDVYVDGVSGSDATGNGTKSAPFLTLGRAMAAKPYYTGHCRFWDAHVGGSVIELGGDPLKPTTNTYQTPRLVGEGEPPCLIGQPWKDAGGFGLLAIASMTTTLIKGIGPCSVLHFNGAPFAAHALEKNGNFVQVVESATPSNVGEASQVLANTANSITMMTDYTGFVAPGDVVGVQVPATTLRINEAPSQLRGALLLIGCRQDSAFLPEFNVCGSLDVVGGASELGYFACDITLSDGVHKPGDLRVWEGAYYCELPYPPLLSDNWVVDSAAFPAGIPLYCGSYRRNVNHLESSRGARSLVNSTVVLSPQNLLSGAHTRVLEYVPSDPGATAIIISSIYDDSGDLSIFAGPAQLMLQNCSYSAGSRLVLDASGANLVIDGCDLNGADGVVASQCQGAMRGVTGLQTNAQGVTIKGGTRMRSLGGNTIKGNTGDAGAVKVGGNALAVSWAAIDGGATADSTDVGATHSQLCYFGPA